MSQIMVWDLPTRLFHAFLTIGFVACFTIAQFAGEHSLWFPYHMMLGIVLGVMVLLRLLWGFVGTKYARFGSFLYGPAALFRYLKGAIQRTEPRYIGHNPGSGYATYAMILLVLVVAGTGLLMSSGSEAAEEVHAVAAYALLAVVIVHVLGVAWHTLRHREHIALAMITGTKEGSPEDAIHSVRPFAAVAFLLFVGFLTIGMFRNYDAKKHETTLPILKVVIHLGEAEH